ncbi:MAG: Pvc16 family protein, partial [bacterium]
MALTDTKRAIGGVSNLLVSRLMSSGAAPNVTVGRPGPERTGTGPDSNPRLNLFLYELNIDGSLRNTPLDEGQAAPLWLVLRYLLTAFDRDGFSDSAGAHELLGAAMQALQDLNFFPLDGLPADVVKALNQGPELLKLTFDDASHELISKIMQGTDEKYRCSVAFQIRPVLIAPSQPPEYSLLVGIDYTTNAIIGDAGVKIPVLPSLGAEITSVLPARFEAGANITIAGVDLNLSGISAVLGDVALPIVSKQPDRLVCTVPAALGSGTAISAGTQIVAAVQILPTGRRRSSNLLTADLLPHVATIAPSGLT